MLLPPKPKKQPVTKVDYLTIVFSPDELQRIKTEAKWRFSTGNYTSYKEAYNAVICADVFNESATDDLDFDVETTVHTSRICSDKHYEFCGQRFRGFELLALYDDYGNITHPALTADAPCSLVKYTASSEMIYNDMFNSVHPVATDMNPKERAAHYRSIVKKTQKYKTLTTLIEGDLSNFLQLLNTVVSTHSDRQNDEMPWTMRRNLSGMFTYEHSASLYRHGVNSGVVAWGANNGGCMISFSGTGCAGLDIPKLKKMLRKMPNVKITRLDIAFDDYEGKRDVDSYIRSYEQGGFAKTNQYPNWSLYTGGTTQRLSEQQQKEFKNKHGWNKKYDLIANAGSTFYVGSRKNGKMARIYEKGKQLESETQPNWVRAELELRAIDREIPLDALTNTDELFAAAYPAFEFISTEKFEVPTNTRKRNVETSNARLVKYHSRSYGKHLNFMRNVLEMTDKQIIDELTAHCDFDDMPTSINQHCVLEPNFNRFDDDITDDEPDINANLLQFKQYLKTVQTENIQ